VFLLAIGLKTNTRTLWTQQLGFFFTSYAPVAEWFAQIGGLETPAKSGVFKWTNFIEIGKARDKILSLELDQVHSTFQLCYIQLISTQISVTSTTSGSATSVDPKGYLTSLNTVILKSDAEIGDIKRACMLFNSLVGSQLRTRKSTPDGWWLLRKSSRQCVNSVQRVKMFGWRLRGCM